MNDENQTRRERLSAYQDQSVKTVSRGYTRFVKTLRVLLPLLAIGIVGILIFSSDQTPPALPVEKIETPIITNENDNKPVIEKNELIKPQFESQTRDGKTYRITAENATQELRQPDMILLEKPQGILESEPYPLKVRAEDGTYNQKTQFITLNKNIIIAQEESGEIHLKTLEADLSRGEIFSPHPIEAKGPYGHLDASALKITNDGNTILFEGPATLTLEEGFETWLE